VAAHGKQGGVNPMPDHSLDLSILVVARNEEKNLPACLADTEFARERVVVLDRCTDGSAMVAQQCGARILEGAWPMEDARRNAGIELCRSAWVLELDADERISPELRRELQSTIADGGCDYYYVPMHNYIADRWVRDGWGAYNGVAAKPALFRKGAKLWGAGEVHPKLTLRGKSGRLAGHIDHFVDADVSSVVERLNRYTTAAARDAVREGRRLVPRTTARRFFSRFIKSYWQRRGYREGWRGVLIALFSGLYPVLTHIKALELRERVDPHV
jgi:glycosyltransferase involved in cell wall biosynthesis